MILCSAVWCGAVLCYVVPRRVASCLVVSCRVVSCRVVSCRVVSCRVVSCCVVPSRLVSSRLVLSRRRRQKGPSGTADVSTEMFLGPPCFVDECFVPALRAFFTKLLPPFFSQVSVFSDKFPGYFLTNFGTFCHIFGNLSTRSAQAEGGFGCGRWFDRDVP